MKKLNQVDRFGTAVGARIEDIRLWIFPISVGRGPTTLRGIDARRLKLTLTSVRKFGNAVVVRSYLAGGA
jgi:hypothetical protein